MEEEDNVARFLVCSSVACATSFRSVVRSVVNVVGIAELLLLELEFSRSESMLVLVAINKGLVVAG
jgi:hypothetical protein